MKVTGRYLMHNAMRHAGLAEVVNSLADTEP